MSLRDFQIVTKLGDGAFSTVYKVKRLNDGYDYALKKVRLLNLSDKEKQNALNEIRILASIRHPNVIGYKEAFLDESTNALCIIMEYANNGDLHQKIVEHQRRGCLLIPENEIWNIFLQMIKGLKALHDLKIFHRDLKSANVYLNKDGSVKLGDLNVSKIAKKGYLYTQTGTPYYASPEVWRDQPYDHKSDIWSAGCVLYEMAALKPPFRAEDMEGLYKKILRGFYPKISSSYSMDLHNIIRGLLQVSAQARPNCDQILQLPSIIKRLDDKILLEFDESQRADFLNTIRMPRNLHFLTERLPKPNYTLAKVHGIDPKSFIQSLILNQSPVSKVNKDVLFSRVNKPKEFVGLSGGGGGGSEGDADSETMGDVDKERESQGQLPMLKGSPKSPKQQQQQQMLRKVAQVKKHAEVMGKVNSQVDENYRGDRHMPQIIVLEDKGSGTKKHERQLSYPDLTPTHNNHDIQENMAVNSLVEVKIPSLEKIYGQKKMGKSVLRNVLVLPMNQEVQKKENQRYSSREIDLILDEETNPRESPNKLLSLSNSPKLPRLANLNESPSISKRKETKLPSKGYKSINEDLLKPIAKSQNYNKPSGSELLSLKAVLNNGVGENEARTMKVNDRLVSEVEYA